MTASPIDCVIGKRYHVPCAYDDNLGDIIPILGPAHEDAQCLGVHIEHWHIDYRFLTERIYRRCVGARPTPFGGFVKARQTVSGAPPGDPMPVTVRRIRCRREMPTFPITWERNPGGTATVIRWLAALEATFADKVLPVCGKCPHRGIPVGMMRADADGNVTCPGHGLTWNLASRKLVRRTHGGEPC